MRRTEYLICAVVIWSQLAALCLAQSASDDIIVGPPEPFEKLLQQIAAGEATDREIRRHISQLVVQIDANDKEVSMLAMYALSQLKDGARPASDCFCRKLADPDHSVRRLAIDGLVGIGRESIAPLRQVMISATGKTRSTAIQGLARLHGFEFAEMEKLVTDTDPRVRMAMIGLLVDERQRGVSLLIRLLNDYETAVASESVRGLQSNRSDPAAAVPALIEVLSRPELTRAAGQALSAYGMDAQRSIPWIIKAFDLTTSINDSNSNAAHALLEHIGPPHALDIPLLCQSLEIQVTGKPARVSENPILAAQSLALMGREGHSAAGSLKTAMNESFKLLRSVDRSIGFDSLDAESIAYKLTTIALECAVAHWRVTGEIAQLIEDLEQVVLCAEEWSISQLAFQVPWNEFSKDDCRRIHQLLTHSNPFVVLTGLMGVMVAGPNAIELKPVIIEIAKDSNNEHAQQGLFALAALGPEVAAEAIPILIAKYREHSLSFGEFARAVGSLQNHNLEIRTILENGCWSGEPSDPPAGISALVSIGNDPLRTSELILELSLCEQLDTGSAISALRRLKRQDEPTIAFYLRQLEDEAPLVRAQALWALAEIDPPDATSLDHIQRRLMDWDEDVRFAAAAAIDRLTGDATPLQKEGVALFDVRGNFDSNLVGALGEMKGHANRFLKKIVDEIHRGDECFDRPSLIRLLAGIRSNESEDALRELSESKDWKLRTEITTILNDLRAIDRKERNHAF